MRRLIDDLLSLTRIELNEHVPPQGRVDLEGRGARSRRRAGAAGPGRPHRHRDRGEAPKLPPVTGERDELMQLFQNLIHNAIKYGRDGGHVWITLDRARRTRSRWRCATTARAFPPPRCRA